MRITAIAARTVRWPIAGTGAARGRSERAAALLEVRSDSGLVGLGEAAPLPGMSRDTLDEAEQALAAFAALAPFELAARPTGTDAGCLPFEFVDPHIARALADAPPSARFAIETALCDALARELGVSLAALLHAHVGTVRDTHVGAVPDPQAITANGAHVGAASQVAARAGGDPWARGDSAESSPSGIRPPSAHVGAASQVAARAGGDPWARGDSAESTPSGIRPPSAHVGAESQAAARAGGDPGARGDSAESSPSGIRPPSAHAGAESQVAAAAGGDPWARSDSAESSPSGIRPPSAHVGAAVQVPLSAVVDDPDAARRASAAGVRSFKIKLTAEDPVDRAFAISAAAPDARLRIDANRSWPADEVIARLAALAALPIDYVEEPCRDAHRLLAEPLPCKLALDESLATLSPDELAAALRSGQLAALVLKPTVLGGFSAVLALAARARGAGVAAVASHALEGPIGTAACAELALALALAAHDAAASRALEAPIRKAPCAEFALAGEDAAASHALEGPIGTAACGALALANAGGTAPPAAGLAAHAALAGWQLTVAQIAGDHVRAAAAPGLGFAGVDLAAAARACPAQGAAAADPTDAHPDAAPGEAQRG